MEWRVGFLIDEDRIKLKCLITKIEGKEEFDLPLFWRGNEGEAG